jgi:hypothetical protein
MAQTSFPALASKPAYTEPIAPVPTIATFNVSLSARLPTALELDPGL